MFQCSTKTLRMASCALVLASFAASHLIAQVKTLTRQFDPVVVDVNQVGGSAALENLKIDEWTAYRYDAASDRFIAIPFQIDDMDSKGSFFGDDEAAGFIDPNDEISFMPGDAGDRAPAEKWVSGADTLRLELAVTDTLNPGETAWVYLFRNLSPLPLPAYVNYSPDPNGAGADTVKGVSYYVGNDSSNGLPTYATTLTSAGEQSPDLLDRLKIRVTGTIPIINRPLEISEDSGLKFESVKQGGGPVRLFRELELEVGIPGLFDSLLTISFSTQYFPYSTKLEAKNAVIPPEVEDLLKHIRQSTDLNENARNMRFYDAANTGGILIDGDNTSDSPDLTLMDGETNWLMASGQHGAILVLIDVPAIGDTRTLYYYDDDQTGTTADGTADTGDGKSYGDFGIQIDGTRISGSFSLDFVTYYLEPSAVASPVEVGQQFKAWQENPLQVTATAQSFPTSVASHNETPAEFALFEAYPNPFSPAGEVARIPFSTGDIREAARLYIYNLIGQEVARFSPLSRNGVSGGLREITWNATDSMGRPLPAGIYFYKLQAGNRTAVKKLVLVR